jgi:hypothetical protein
MTTSDAAPWADCQVCGHTDHNFQRHLGEVAPPEFIRSSVTRLRDLERAGGPMHSLVTDVSHLADAEEGGRKAWALWLLTLLGELERSADVPEVAAEIENYLMGGFAT